METEKKKILEIKNLSISFKTSSGELKAIRGVNFTLNKGETIAIVGESGSGKSVTVKSILGIKTSNEYVNSGEILYTYTENKKEKTVDLLKISDREMVNTYCGQKIAMVFQDPLTSLNPVMPVGKQLVEGMRKHRRMNRGDAWGKGVQLLEDVGIPDPELTMKCYPHQLSGGMRQRVVIAIALSLDPDILICDEPTTALDVTIQAKILELITKLQRERNISVIYITHDMGVVAKVADYVCVMYAGKIIERGTAEDIYFRPRHPYTWGLLLSIPDLNESSEKLYAIPGSPPNLLNLITWDAFAPRNKYALNIDFEEEPPVFKISDTHEVSSWLEDKRAPKTDMPVELKERIKRMEAEAQ
jgi:oligopeptide transport system ATP-binding protein